MWTLKEEIERRGLTPVQACKLCGMDMPTFAILLNGGQTLPQLAMRVVRGLGLKRDQAKVLGKALDRRNWPTKSSSGMGLAVPKPIDVDPEWWRRVGE